MPNNPARPLVYILLLNYRGADDTLACLESLQTLDYPNYRVIVIDNASPDDSAARLQARLASHPDEFTLICSDKNLGFSGGNNLGIRHALAQSSPDSPTSQTTAPPASSEAGSTPISTQSEAFIWLLNNDTTVAPDTLTHLIHEAQKTGGVAGSLLLYPDGRYQQVGTRIRWWTGGTQGYPEAEISDGMAVETLTGASMLIPFNALNKAGLLDESFFLYFEDGEYSLRCSNRGFSLTVSLKSKVYHKEGATTGRKSRPTQYYYHRNRMRMLMMYANPLQKITISAYAAFRMLRAGVKSLCGPDPDRKISARIQWVALRDFCQGVSGPCPHNLETL